ncbi:MAG: BamA/TamA family outer membrane protein, partial [Ignavibacteriales bacterium]|nr:BamA/TamA family outer membrane protein [Ignavibacteriales bacterium]
GNDARFSQREYYTREPLEITLSCSRGWTKTMVGQIGVKYKSVKNFNFSDTSALHQLPAINRTTAKSFGIAASFRYDTRNSFINPSAGTVLLAEGEINPSTGLSNVSYSRAAMWLQYYHSVIAAKVVVATRIGIQQLFGNDIPVQMLLPMGGNRTLRGSPQDRFLDKASIVLNGEVRFPIVWRFGGVAGCDAGTVWNSLSRINFSRWEINSVIGLRFFMDTFVVRADAGFGRDATGFYLNFGHLF